MDILCPRCGQPWDLDSLHDEAQTRFPPQDESAPPWSGPDDHHDQAAYPALFHRVREDFAARGCQALESLDGRCNVDTIDSATAQRSALLMSLLGDDIDAIAAMTEDLQFLSDAGDPDIADLL